MDMQKWGIQPAWRFWQGKCGYGKCLGESIRFAATGSQASLGMFRLGCR